MVNGVQLCTVLRVMIINLQCLQLIRIRPYSYGFFVVCTDIRKLCSIIRKSDSHMKGLTSATCCQYGTIMEVSDESESDASVSRLLDDTTTTTILVRPFLFCFFFSFSFFVSACTYLYCSILFFCVCVIFFSYFMPVLFNLAFFVNCFFFSSYSLLVHTCIVFTCFG